MRKIVSTDEMLASWKKQDFWWNGFLILCVGPVMLTLWLVSLWFCYSLLRIIFFG